METKFHCNKTVRGEPSCEAQCEVCAKRTASDEAEAKARAELEARNKEIAERQAEGQPETGPKIKAALAVVLYENGHVTVDGPFEDRITFAGLLYLAQDAERMKFAEAVRRSRATLPPKHQHNSITSKVREFFRKNR